MHKIDGPGHASNTFTEGNPATGTPATTVTDDWLNAVQTEIVNVILAAGITLNKAVNTQLLSAIQALVAAASTGLLPANNLSDVLSATTALANLGGAPKASPAFTGTPTAPTAANGTNTTQLATCAFAYGQLSTSANGYVKLPNGLILQWGQTGGAAGQYTVTFPIAFPNTCLLVFPTSQATQTSGSFNNQWLNNGYTATSFQGYKDSTQSINWFAIGY